MAELRTLPGPKQHFPFQHTVAYVRDPLHFLGRIARNYGGFVRLRIGGRECCLVSDPECIELILRTGHENFTKGNVIWRSPNRLRRRLWSTLRRPLGASEADRHRHQPGFWRRQRQLILPAFQTPMVRHYDGIVIDETERMLGDWDSGATFDLIEELIPVTLKIVARALFGLDLRTVTAQVCRNFDIVIDSCFEPASRPLSATARAQLARTQQCIDEVFYDAIRSRADNSSNRYDLLSRLMMADEDTGRKPTGRMVRDEMITILLSGHKTIALAVTYACYLLARHPEAGTRMAHEADRLSGSWFTAPSEAAHCRYADQVMRESLRLFPPAWMIEREPLTPCEIGGYQVPAGTQLLLSAWVVHHDPKWWERPDSFEPERWNAPILTRVTRGAYFPFGLGPQTCVAEHFAVRAAILILLAMFRRFRPELLSAKPLQLLASDTLQPLHGLKMRVHTRDRVDAFAAP